MVNLTETECEDENNPFASLTDQELATIEQFLDDDEDSSETEDNDVSVMMTSIQPADEMNAITDGNANDFQVSKESDGKLSKDQWLNVFIEAKIHNSS